MEDVIFYYNVMILMLIFVVIMFLLSAYLDWKQLKKKIEERDDVNGIQYE